MKKDEETLETAADEASSHHPDAPEGATKSDAPARSAIAAKSKGGGKNVKDEVEGDETDDGRIVAKGTGPYREAAEVARYDEEAGIRDASSKKPPPRRILRSVYWAAWFMVTPFVLACLLVWALTPASGVDHGGLLGWIEEKVRDQPVPFGIVTFTLFEMALWAVRHQLPLAYHAHPPLRDGLPKGMRAPFEKARGLIEEAEAIFERNDQAVERELSTTERERLRADLDALERSMDAAPFDEEAFLEALVKADGEVDAKLGRWRKSEVREYAESILVAIAVAMALRAFVVEAFKIPSGSMIPTLQVGDHIFVNKFTYGPAIPWTHSRVWSHLPPERGDVIVFAYPERPEQDFIKRVIAIPGDKLEARGGHPIINGWEVPSCPAGTYTYTEQQDGARHEGEVFVEFLEDEAYLTLYDHQSLSTDYQGPYYVKPNEAWVMGDNRNNSHDSRMWFGGTGGGVPFENVKGRALFVWLSVSETIDWSRMFAPVMGRPPSHGPLPGMNPALKALEGPVEKCLRDRPPLDKTRPPPSSGTIR
ncbi:MAG TPA: signal peptidase I [Labilithrix sp.]|nr:signal peptidase I [Labilithrix sp.]